MSARSKTEASPAAETLTAAGLRPTRQRVLVYETLAGQDDHPSAEVIYERARATMPTLSLATVYNCLESFAQAGLIRAIHIQRQSTRYCTVREEAPHFAHFHCRRTGAVYDIVLPDRVRRLLEEELPEGMQPEDLEINFTGVSAEGHSYPPHAPIVKESPQEP